MSYIYCEILKENVDICDKNNISTEKIGKKIGIPVSYSYFECRCGNEHITGVFGSIEDVKKYFPKIYSKI